MNSSLSDAGIAAILQALPQAYIYLDDNTPYLSNSPMTAASPF